MAEENDVKTLKEKIAGAVDSKPVTFLGRCADWGVKGLILGFTFKLGADKYDARKEAKALKLAMKDANVEVE